MQQVMASMSGDQDIGSHGGDGWLTALAVQRQKRAAVHRKGSQPAIAAALRPDVLVTTHRSRHLHLPMLLRGGHLG